jgi:integrase
MLLWDVISYPSVIPVWGYRRSLGIRVVVRISKQNVDSWSEEGEYRDDQLKGFCLRIRSSGKKVYAVHGRLKGGKALTYTLGEHGAPWTPKQARERAEEVILTMKKGIDPRELDRKARKELEDKDAEKIAAHKLKEITLRKVFLNWFETNKTTKISTKKLYRDLLFKHLEDWLELPLLDITEEMVSEKYDLISRQTVASANNSFRALRMLFNWSRKRYKNAKGIPFILENPVTILTNDRLWQGLKPRREYLVDEDLEPWYKAVSKLSNSLFSDYFKLLFVTGLRKDEAASLKWKNIDFKKKTFTAMDTKNGSDFTLPLTPYTEALFKSRSSDKMNEYVFHSVGKYGHIKDVRYYQEIVIEESSVDFSPHELRRTFSYAAARVKLGDSERKALLNHLRASDVTDAHYTPWAEDHLRESLILVEQFLLEKAGQ